MDNVNGIESRELVSRLVALGRLERRQLVEFLAYLAEVERRKFFLEMAFASMFAFCTEYLGLSHGETFRRTNAARLMARFPVVADYLADGRLSLTTLVELRGVLDEGCLDAVLGRAAGKNEEDVKRLVAALQPREAPADLLRRCPAPPAPVPALPPPALPAPAERAIAGPAIVPAPEPVIAGPAIAPARPAVALEPISADRYTLRTTVTDQFKADLMAVRDALSHQIPDGQLGEVLHHCVRVALAACEKRRRGAGRNSATADQSTDKRDIPTAMSEVVWRRDESRCAFVSADGRRCNSTWQLEVHHITPFARPHASTVDDLALRCRAHNAYHAIQDFGADTIARAIRANMRASGP